MAEEASGPSGLRRGGFLFVTCVAWVAAFTVLGSRASWTSFFFAGVTLSAGAVLLRVVPLSLLRPTPRLAAVGAGAGLLMVVVTHAAYRAVTALWPAAADETAKLFDLFKAEGFSPAARASLLAAIAATEEILFRGTLPGPSGPHALRAPTRRELGQAVLSAGLYALVTAALGSPLLVLCAFICGFLWGALRFATGSLVAPILAHLLWDLGVLVIWPLTG